MCAPRSGNLCDISKQDGDAGVVGEHALEVAQGVGRQRVHGAVRHAVLAGVARDGALKLLERGARLALHALLQGAVLAQQAAALAACSRHPAEGGTSWEGTGWPQAVRKLSCPAVWSHLLQTVSGQHM